MMAKKKPSFYLISLRDILSHIKSAYKKILLLALTASLLVLTYNLLKPVTYTATAIFKTPPPSASLWMDFLTKEKEAIPHEDPRVLLNSFPITAKVVQKLHLQGFIKTAQPPCLLHRIWQNFYLERCFATLGKQEQPLSEILINEELVPNHPLNFFKDPHLQFSDLFYTGDVYKIFYINFLDAHHFSVTDARKKEYGQGVMNESFHFPHGHFTLSGQPLEKKIEIHLIPLKSAAHSLSKAVTIKKDRTRPALLTISYQSQNAHLAINIVNTIMECYQEFANDLALEQGNRHYCYLKERQNQALTELSSILASQKDFRLQHMHEGGFLELKDEAHFVVEKKQHIADALLDIKADLLRLSSQIFPQETLSWESILEKIASLNPNPNNLSLNSLNQILHSYEQELDKVQWEKKHFDLCLDILQDPQCDLSILLRTIKEASLSSLISATEELIERFHDPLNWSNKERDLIAQNIQSKKNHLRQELQALKNARCLQENFLREKLKELHKDLIKSFAQEYQKLHILLTELNQQEVTFPEKWIQEETLSLHCKMTLSMMEQISKALEINNLSSKMALIHSFPFEKAMQPLLPDAPKLLYKALLAGCLAVFSYCLYLLIKHLITGPKATYHNLKGIQAEFVGEAHVNPPPLFSACDLKDQQCLKSLAHQLHSYLCVLLLSSRETTFWHSFFDLIRVREERVAIVHFQKGHIPHFDNFFYKTEKLWESEIFSSKNFMSYIEKLKNEYKKIFLIYEGPFPENLYNIASKTVLFIHHEMIYDLPEAFYITERKPLKKEKKVYFSEIEPLLSALQKKIFLSKMIKNLFKVF